MAKTFTIFFFGTRSSVILKLGVDHQGLNVYKVYKLTEDLCFRKQWMLWGSLSLPHGMTIIFKHFLCNSSTNQSKLSCGVFRRGVKKYKNGLGHMNNMAVTPIYIYIVKTFKIFFSRTRSLMILELGIEHWRLNVFIIRVNDNSGLTLTLFKAK